MENVSFQILDACDSADCNKWLAVWNLFPEREVFAHPNYAKLYTEDKNKAYCAVLESSQGRVLYPFIYRDLKESNFHNLEIPQLADIITPYGYGGPFAWGYNNLTELSSVFWSYFDKWAYKNNIVSEVIKFSLFPENILIYPGTKEEELKNIVVNLDMGEEELWTGFEHKVRKNVKRAKQKGISIIVDTNGEKLNDFFNIYKGTLDRRKADNRHYFPLSFFEKIKLSLGGQFAYFHAIYEGRIISTELVLISRNKTYSFLGGTDKNSFALRSNDLLKYEIILWAKSQGKSKFVLGGGHKPDDGIYRYKRSFAPQGKLPFLVGTRILRPDLYNALIESRRQLSRRNKVDWIPEYGYIPEYRTQSAYII